MLFAWIFLLIPFSCLIWQPVTAAPKAGAFTLAESFMNTTAPNWALSGHAVLTANTEGAGNGWLRLTSNGTNQAGSAIYHTAFDSAGGVQITFQYATYGGSGADGFSIYFIDGSTGSPTVGATGGALGYASSAAVSGVTNGYAGIGFDEWGNFSTNLVGSCHATIPCPGRQANSVTVRGSGSLLAGFNYLARASQTIGTINRAGAKTVRVTIQSGVLTVEVLSGGVFLKVIDQLNLTTAPGQAPLPATLKLGFSAATGGSTNYHEIRNVTATTLTYGGDSQGFLGAPLTFGGNPISITRSGTTVNLGISGSLAPFPFRKMTLGSYDAVNNRWQEATCISQRDRFSEPILNKFYCANYVGNVCSEIVVQESRSSTPGTIFSTQTLKLQDRNSDGLFETFNYSRTGKENVSITSNLVLTSSGGNSFISIPWALAHVIGHIDGTTPQVIPLSPDGRIAFDFDGDKSMDTDLFFNSVPLAGTPIRYHFPTVWK